MSSGELRGRVTFQKRADLSDTSPPGDGYGNTEGDWQDQFTVSARIWPRLGGETVMANRLSGKQPLTIQVRQSAQTRTVTTDWRAFNARTGTEYNIRSIVDPDEHTSRHGMYLDILAEAGVAT